MPKQKLEEVIGEIPKLESIQYIPLQQIQHTPQLYLPSNINIERPLAIFSLFFKFQSH
jgi:hypothetical protein